MRFRAYQFAIYLAALAAVAPRLAWATVPLAEPRPVTGAVELPTNDPFTAPLEFSTAEHDLFVDAADGLLDEHSLVEAALIASGITDDAALAHYRAQFGLQCDELRHRTNGQMAVKDKIESIHQLLHERLLRRYEADATALTTTFDTGVYNCASGTTLLIALAAEIGLDVQAIELPGHVRAIVADGSMAWEVEITSQRWSEAIREFQADGLKKHPDPKAKMESVGSSAVFNLYSGNDAVRAVSNLGLIAMIYYNQGIDAFHQHRFAAAMAANRRALLLDGGNAKARGNLLAAANNWALALWRAGDSAIARRLLTWGCNYAPEHQAFAFNVEYVRRLDLRSANSH